MEKIKDYFNRYPASDEVFENDGVLFHTEGAAESYGKGETTRYARKSVMETDTSDVAPEDTGDDETKKTVDLTEDIETVKATEDLSSLPYEELKRLVKVFDIKTDDQKKETFINVLTTFKNQLNNPE